MTALGLPDPSVGPRAQPPSVVAARLLVDTFLSHREPGEREAVAQWIAATGDSFLHARAEVLGGVCQCYWCKRVRFQAARGGSDGGG